MSELQVTDAMDRLAMVETPIRGEARRGEAGRVADTVALNAGAAIYVSGGAESVEEGIGQAQDVLATGVGLERLKQYASRSYTL